MQSTITGIGCKRFLVTGLLLAPLAVHRDASDLGITFTSTSIIFPRDSLHSATTALQTSCDQCGWPYTAVTSQLSNFQES